MRSGMRDASKRGWSFSAGLLFLCWLHHARQAYVIRSPDGPAGGTEIMEWVLIALPESHIIPNRGHDM